jgi:hypothetical protein
MNMFQIDIFHFVDLLVYSCAYGNFVNCYTIDRILCLFCQHNFKRHEVLKDIHGRCCIAFKVVEFRNSSGKQESLIIMSTALLYPYFDFFLIFSHMGITSFSLYFLCLVLLNIFHIPHML